MASNVCEVCKVVREELLELIRHWNSLIPPEYRTAEKHDEARAIEHRTLSGCAKDLYPILRRFKQRGEEG